MFKQWSWLAGLSLLMLATRILLFSGIASWAADDDGMSDAAPAPVAAPVQANFDLVKIPSGSLTIYGILWKPKGDGPFPAVVYNHGSEQKVANKGYGVVGNFYRKNGFVCLVPLRRGHSYSANMQLQCTSDGDLFDDRVAQQAGENPPPGKKNKIWIKEQDVDNRDVAAAVEWLKTQPYVDSKNIVMSGISFGGIQTCLASEKGLGVRAFVPFAPGAMSWQGLPEVHDRLKQALENAKAPVFLIQAENDYNLGPSNYLGPVLDKKGPPNRHKVYPPFQVERGHAGGHGGFAVNGEDVWASDVSAFLQDAVGSSLPKLTN
jgi:dienelactone hydrolase